MAANQSIKELMTAETKASKIISEARQGDRLKQAKAEAEAEINAGDYEKNKEAVLNLMYGHVTKVVLKVPAARKESHKA
ncbi:hypothetical protein DYB26_002997 [Aphanomyces astaci]|uniref:V-type proton ATPase subunit G n=1 Tax=Aphanomyces astaci TaxID=112090 RepID=A0A418DV24_APHAT|nr:hypothetical protein DYB26_002997 [Aphanomyces astaci]